MSNHILALLQQEKELSNAVRLFREYVGLSQEQLAVMVGCSKTQITRIERGRFSEIRSTWYITAVCNIIMNMTGVEVNAEPYLNRNAQTNSQTGKRGVCYDAKRKNYIATIGFKGARFYLGRYSTAEQALQVRLTAEQKAADGMNALVAWISREVKQDKSS